MLEEEQAGCMVAVATLQDYAHVVSYGTDYKVVVEAHLGSYTK